MPQYSLSDITDAPPVPAPTAGILPTVPTGNDPETMEKLVRSTAQKYNINPDHFARMAATESSFNPRADSGKAQGLMQLTPDTASLMGVTDPFNPSQSVEGGAKYFSQLLKRFGGDYKQATAAYNFGPERVAAGKDWPQETKDYVQKIMNPEQAFQKAASGYSLGDVVGGVPAAVNEYTGSGEPSKFSWSDLFGPNYAAAAQEKLKEQMPWLAGAAATIAMPEVEGPALLGKYAPLAGRIATAAGKAIAYGAGYGVGRVGEEVAGGNVPDIEKLEQISREMGPQTVLQGLFELPGVLSGGARNWAATRMRDALGPTGKEMKQGVIDTMLEEKIAPNKNMADKAREIINPLTDRLDQVYADNAGSVIKQKPIEREYADWMKTIRGSKERDAAQEVWDNWFRTGPGGVMPKYPGGDIPIEEIRGIKQEVRNFKNFLGEESPNTREAARTKIWSLLADDKIGEGALDSRFSDINPRLGKLINVENAGEKYVQRMYGGPPLPWYMNRHLAALGAGMGGQYTFHNPWAGLGIGAVTEALSSPDIWSKLGYRIAQNPETARQLIQYPGHQLFDESEVGAHPQNLEDMKVNLMNSPYLQGMLNRGK